MRATELMGCVVFDGDGELIGHVHDLRLEAVRAGGASDDVRYRVTGLQCGGAAVGHRLGYGHGDMAGPWILSALVRWMRRKSVVVEWRDVARFEAPNIYLNRRSVSGANGEEPR
jgi:hypothetical protein